MRLLTIFLIGFLFSQAFASIDKQLIGKYKTPLIFGGIMEFRDDGILVIALNAPPGSKKGPTVIKEKFEVKGDMIHFVELSINGKSKEGKKSQQRIVELTDDYIILEDQLDKLKTKSIRIKDDDADKSN